jgi:hypothetical protein
MHGHATPNTSIEISSAHCLGMITLKQEVELTRITELRWQTTVQCFQTVPAHGSLCFGFRNAISNKHPQGLAIGWITGFKFSNGERSGVGRSRHVEIPETDGNTFIAKAEQEQFPI